MKASLLLFALLLTFTCCSQSWLWQSPGVIHPNAKSSHQLFDTTDAAGNIYITGSFDTSMLDLGSIQLMNPNRKGGTSVFIAKFNSEGRLLWSRAAGGNSYDSGNFICADAAGNVYVTGDFRSDTLRFGSSAIYNSFPGKNSEDMFLAKYNAKGSLVWLHCAGGKGIDIGRKVYTDSLGNVYVEGTSLSKTMQFMNKTLSPYDTTKTSMAMHFTAKYDRYGVFQSAWQSDKRQLQVEEELKEVFYKALSEQKVKIRCGGCEGYGFSVQLIISKFGAMSYIGVTVDKACDPKKGEIIKKKIAEYCGTLKDLDEFKGRTVYFHLSRILKC